MLRRKPVLDKALLRRIAVNFIGSQTTFIGHLAEYDNKTYVFEQCETVPGVGETAQIISGRQYVDRAHVWLQELPT